LFLAFAVAAPVLLAQDSDHDRDANHGPDPAIGSWVVHVHSTDFTPTPPPFPLPFDFDNLAALVAGGINIGVAPQNVGTSVGVWKKVGNRMYDTKLVQINPTIDTVLGDNLMLNQQGNEMTGSFTGFDFPQRPGK